MSTFDKIRVLWIDDREEMDGYPEAEITPPEYKQWFEIVHPGSIDESLSFRSVKEFAPVFQEFWFKGDSSVLPAEIIATDYNLSKQSGVAVLDQTAKQIDKDLNDPEDDDDPDHTESKPISSPSVLRGVNFEGLLISLFYATLLYKYPAAIVPMTRYLSEMPSEVDTLHRLVEPFLGVDFRYIGLEDRRWASILKEGIRHLRRRIGDLYRSGEINLSPSDLMSMVEDANHDVLTIRSPHTVYCENGVRRLPVQGLFIDTSEDNRNAAIHKWTRDLMSNVMVHCEELRQAQELARVVWEAYNNNDLVEDRKNLSLLASRKEAGHIIDEEKYNRLCETFQVTNKKVKSGYVDIVSTGDYSNRVRRWATLLITKNLMKRHILIKERIDNHFYKKTGQATDNAQSPILSASDLFLALFPIPGSPLILPWHSGSGIDNSSTWVRSMMRWKQQKDVAKNRGDLALSINDLLAGANWKPEGPYGLTDSERLVLRGLAMDDHPELPEKDWRSYPKSSLVLWGNQDV